MKTEYPFWPKTPEEFADRMGKRINEAHAYFFKEDQKKRFPAWVLKMGKSVREQMLSRNACIAIDQPDEPFLVGLFVGIMIALKHHYQTTPQDNGPFGLLVGMATAKHGGAEMPETPPASVGEVVNSPEISDLTSSLFSELHKESEATRNRVLEGLKEGNEHSQILQGMLMRPGLALHTHIFMLLFWPEIDAMKTRREAYNFLQVAFDGMPSEQRSEEAFIKLMQNYGFKRRRVRKVSME